VSKLSEPNVGQCIRKLRETRKLSLRALAKHCGLSANAISRIERGENSPTVSTLHMLATALEVPITDFFEMPQARTTVVVRRDQRLQSEGDGVIMQSLGTGLRRQQLEPFLVHIAPGTSSKNTPITHSGQEFVYCLKGIVHYKIADQQYTLEAGDSLLFEATQPHTFHTPDTTPAQIVLVFYASHQARAHHLRAD
jgi:transcriptional regulator with XRE-family HTH domain